MTKNLPASLVAILFLLGVFTCTWDLLLTRDIGGFTIKAQQILFGASFLGTLWLRRGDLKTELPSILKSGFAVCLLLLAGFYAAGSYWSSFPLKSFLYSAWLLFNFCVVWINSILLAPYLFRGALLKTVVATLGFHALVVLVDLFAYKFGFTGGFIGHNQDIILHWGVPRPHAFSNEPSYIAVFFALGILLLMPELFSRFDWKRGLFASVLVFALVATTSRTGVLGLALGLFLYLLLQITCKRAVPWKELKIISVVLLVAGATSFLASSPSQRDAASQKLITSVTSGSDGSGNARLSGFKKAFQIAQESNWLGVGLGASYKYWTDLRPDHTSAAADKNSSGHELIMSIWGQLMAEGGATALLLYSLAAFFLIRSFWERWQQTGDTFILGATISSIAFFCFFALWIGNIARGDIWIWFGIWSRLAVARPESPHPVG